MKKILTLLAVLLMSAILFAETYTVNVTGTITKKDAEGQFTEITGECFIDDEDTIYLEEGTMISFVIGNKSTTIKGPKSPIKFGELLTKLKLK